MKYNGGLTREQFLFNEARIVAKLKLENKSDDEIINEVCTNNLFQYPTERMIRNLVQVCLKRIDELGNMNLVNILANGSYESAKQVNFYALLKKELLLREFMMEVVADKFRYKEYTFSKSDVLTFLHRLQEQDDAVASWSDSTVQRIRQIIVKMMVEVGYLDKHDSKMLNDILLDYELERGIVDNGDSAYLPIFNRFV